MRDPLLAPLAAIAAGVLLSQVFGFEQLPLLTASCACALLGAVALWRALTRAAMTACLAGFLFAGALANEAARPGKDPELDQQGAAPILIGGCVVEPPAFSEDRAQFVLELAPQARARVTLYARDGESLPAIGYGEDVEVLAKVRKPRDFANPGSFRYSQYLARQRVYWTASAPASSLKRTGGRCGNAAAAWIWNLRAVGVERIDALYAGRNYEAGMMRAILLGDASRLQRVWTEDFRSTGTFHALVISGTHIAVLASFLLFLMRVCRVPEWIALWCAALAAWLYAIVAGWQPPVVRAAAGFTLFALARTVHRRSRVLNLLAAVAMGFLLIDPGALFDPSFQLSFLAVALLGAIAGPVTERTTRPYAEALENLADAGRDPAMEPRQASFRVEMRLLVETLRLATRLPVWAVRVPAVAAARFVLFVAEVMLLSACVQTGLALPMVVYFHRIGFSGLTANAIIIPLMEAIVPAGFIAIFTGWGVPAWFAGLLLDWSRRAAAWHAQWEPAWRVPPPPFWLASAFCLLLLAVAVTIRRAGWLRWGTLALFAAAFAVLIVHPFPAQIPPGRLEMTAIDVGQGDAILVTFPDGKTLLMDAGGIPVFGGRTPARLDTGEDVVAPYLWRRSIRRLDAVALSHAHQDHIGGLVAIIENFRPRELWTGNTPDVPQWDRLRKSALAHGVRIRPLRAGESFAYGGAGLQVLAPTGESAKPDRASNNDSLAVRLSYGHHSFLLTGDIEKQVEWDLAARGELVHADVLKVAHHGSRSSSTAEFLDAVRPAVAVISAGEQNSYGHPHAEVIDRLASRGAELLRTDRLGLITVSSDGTRLRTFAWGWEPAVSGLTSPF